MDYAHVRQQLAATTPIPCPGRRVALARGRRVRHARRPRAGLGAGRLRVDSAGARRAGKDAL
eukprot:9642386-Alexandrium_andersonii.AAC.1